MKQTSDLTSRVRVLAVSQFEHDHTTLAHIIGHSAWELESVRTLREAATKLIEESLPVVLCSENLTDGDWKDLLSLTGQDAASCRLIVMSDRADDRLWAEVLNLGAYDVLAKPLRSKEVFASVGQAWRHWQACRKSVGRVHSAPAKAIPAVA